MFIEMMVDYDNGRPDKLQVSGEQERNPCNGAKQLIKRNL